MTTDEVYKEIFNELIKRKVELFGNFALFKIAQISNLETDSHGDVVSFSVDPNIILSQLLSKFEEFAGKVSTDVSKVIINRIANKYPEFKLPEEFSL